MLAWQNTKRDIKNNDAFMHRIDIILALLFLAIAAQGQQLQRIAILGTEDDGEPSIGILEQAHLTAKLRETANNILPKTRYGVMTQQSIVDRLGSQEQAAKLCREATCLVDLGRKVNADYIAQARIGRFGGNLTIKAELYNVASGNLIASFTGDSENAQGLLSLLEEKAPALFKSMPGVSSGAVAVSPAAVPGGIMVEKGEAYALEYEKRYLVNLSTEPKGANLSFNGVPISSCNRTPCKAELPEGEIRIIAALDQHETADTSVSIMRNNQSINIKLKSNFGTLRIKSAYLDDVDVNENWDLTINGKAYESLENRLSQGTYDVKLSHECYEDINFKVGINKGTVEFFDMAKHVRFKEGVLELRAERGWEFVSEPVFVNGKRVGETPFSGSVPVCSSVRIGENMEVVDVEVKHREKVKHTYKIYDAVKEEEEEQDVFDEGVSVGVRMGFNVNDFRFGYKGANEGMGVGTGFGAGLTFKMPLTGDLSLNMGLDFYYRKLFSRETESGKESMNEFTVSIPVFLQFAFVENSPFHMIMGVQLGFPFGTKWANYYDYVTEHRANVDFDFILGLAYVASSNIGIDFRCAIGLAGLFEDFEDYRIRYTRTSGEWGSYKDRSSLRQYGFGVVYFF
jgi:hypothetical protein